MDGMESDERDGGLFRVILVSDPDETQGVEKEWELEEGITSIGRSKDHPHPFFRRFPNTVSRLHVQLILCRNPPSVMLRQCSKNPTFIRTDVGQALELNVPESTYMLLDGDRFFLLEEDGRESFVHHVQTTGYSFATDDSQDPTIDRPVDMDVQLSLEPAMSSMCATRATRKRKFDGSGSEHRTKRRPQPEDSSEEAPPLVRSTSLNILSDTTFAIQPEELEIERVIARGACGEVSVGKWNGTPVAIKNVLRSLLHGDALKEFQEEASILRNLRHPNVVLFMGMCKDDRKQEYKLVTEFMERGSLTHVLGDKKVDIGSDRVLRFALDAAQGMNYLHNRTPPIIHRDLKSMNLLVDKNFNVKVSDFGLSTKAKGELQRANTLCGTLPWLAPEVLAGNGYTVKADVYSYGVTLWEMLTRSEPYRGFAEKNIISGVLEGKLRPKIPRKCNWELRNLIEECWDQNPDRRPSFKEIVARLNSLLASSKTNGVSMTHKRGSSDDALHARFLKSVDDNSPYDWKIPSQSISLHDHPIAEGPLVNVYRAVYNGQDVAVKIIKNPADQEARESFLAFMAYATTIRMPQIVYLFGGGLSPMPFCVSEFMAKGSVCNVLDGTGEFPWGGVMRLAVEMCKVLSGLHSWSPTILHRNLRPSNLLVDDNFSVKVCDMLPGGADIPITRYTPPEVAQNAYAEPSDVFSYGMILWEVMARHLAHRHVIPFANLRDGTAFEAIVQGHRPEIPAECNPLLGELIMRCWAQNAGKRPNFVDVGVMLQQI